MQAQAQGQYPPLPAGFRTEVLKRLTLLELIIVIERYGTRQIATRIGSGEDVHKFVEKTLMERGEH